MLLIRLVSLATFSPLILAQSSGTIYLNASNPSSGSPTAGCVILGQLAVLSTPHILTAMVPICPSTAGDLASEPLTGMPITWPLTTGGDGAASAMAIYAGITESDDGKSTARCVMNLSQMQAMYLLGRDLDWNNDQNQLWDYTANGWLRDTSKYNVITW